MIKLIDYSSPESDVFQGRGFPFYLEKSCIGSINTGYIEVGVDRCYVSYIYNKNNQKLCCVKETPEEILAMPDIEEGNKTIDWEQRRYEIAKHILPRVFEFGEHKYAAKYAVSYADALIDKLKINAEVN